MANIHINEEADAVFDYAVGLRRHFHQYPETGMNEFETSKTIKAELKSMGIRCREVAPTGVIAEIGHGSPIIALRADIDALDIPEETGVEYQSKIQGKMHACGHDVHMANLLGTARALKQFEQQMNFTVRFIFQPDEENIRGAKIMCAAGAMDGVDQVFGAHVFADIPCGLINIEDGPRMAKAEYFSIEIDGKPGHAGQPQKCIDASVSAAAVLLNLQSIVSRSIDPLHSVVITIGMVQSGTAKNIISGHAYLGGTIRTFSEGMSEYVHECITRVAESTAAAYNTTAAVFFDPNTTPAVDNDPKVAAEIRKAMLRVFPEDAIVSLPKLMLAEDFCQYQLRVPGAFAFLGGGNPQMDRAYPNHHCRFNVDEECIRNGIKAFLAYIVEYGENRNLFV